MTKKPFAITQDNKAEKERVFLLERQVLLKTKFSYVGNFVDGIVAVRDGDVFDGKYGYAKTDGEWLREPLFEFGGTFMNGLARVKLDGNVNFINQSGTFEFEAVEPVVLDFLRKSPEFYLAKKFGKWGAIARKGNVVIAPFYFDEPVKIAKIGIHLNRVDDTGVVRWFDAQGHERTEIAASELKDRNDARSTENAFLWCTITVVTGVQHGQTVTVTRNLTLLPETVPISMFEVTSQTTEALCQMAEAVKAFCGG